MRSNPACNMDSDSCDFPALRVYASQTLDSKGVDAEVRHGSYQNFFKVAHVAMHVFAIRTEIDDWITNHLAQAVIRHFSAAIRLKQRHISRAELFAIKQYRRTFTAPPDRESMGMFEQQQGVRLVAVFDG